MEHIEDLVVLSFTQGLSPLFNKLPQFIRSKWQGFVYRYSQQNRGMHPPFSEFCAFIGEQGQTFSCCLTAYSMPQTIPRVQTERVQQGRCLGRHAGTIRRQYNNYRDKSTYATYTTFKTEATPQAQPARQQCPLHSDAAMPHSLSDCRDFMRMSPTERINAVKQSYVCYRCFGKHPIRDCTSVCKCTTCGSVRHNSMLHLPQTNNNLHIVSTNCTALCGDGLPPRLCSKIVPVVISSRLRPGKVFETLAIIDEQSNTTLAHPDIFDELHADSKRVDYTLKTLGELPVNKTGRVTDLVVHGSFSSQLFNLIRGNGMRNYPECVERTWDQARLLQLATPTGSFKAHTGVSR